MSETIAISLTSIITALGSSIITYILTKRKNKADAENSELNNVQKAIEIWRSLAQDLEKKIEYLEIKIKEIEDSNAKKCKECKYRQFYNENKS